MSIFTPSNPERPISLKDTIIRDRLFGMLVEAENEAIQVIRRVAPTLLEQPTHQAKPNTQPAVQEQRRPFFMPSAPSGPAVAPQLEVSRPPIADELAAARERRERDAIYERIQAAHDGPSEPEIAETKTAQPQIVTPQSAVDEQAAARERQAMEAVETARDQTQEEANHGLAA